MDKADVGYKAESVMEEVHSADERPGSGSQSAGRPHRPPAATGGKTAAGGLEPLTLTVNLDTRRGQKFLWKQE